MINLKLSPRVSGRNLIKRFMKIIKDLPFYLNTHDNTHCFQASLKMILKCFIPEKDFSFEELDKISMKEEGKWTWPMAGLIWMGENGFEVVDLEVFDYAKFIEKGGDYLIEEFGKEVAEALIKNSDTEQGRKLSRLFLNKIKVQKIIPKREDIIKLLDEDYVVMVNVNSRVLNNKDGYIGHFVVIKGYNDDGFIINNPGLPGKENMEVSFDIFERAWAYPNERAKNIMAFKLKRD